MARSKSPSGGPPASDAEITLYTADLVDRLDAERREARYRGTAAVALGGFNLASTVGFLYGSGSGFPVGVWLFLITVASLSTAVLVWWWLRSFRRSGELKAALDALELDGS